MDRLADRHATIGTAKNDKPLTYIDLGCQIRMLEPPKKWDRQRGYVTGPIPRPIRLCKSMSFSCANPKEIIIDFVLSA